MTPSSSRALCRCGYAVMGTRFPGVPGDGRSDVLKHPWSLPGPRGDGNGGRFVRSPCPSLTQYTRCRPLFPVQSMGGREEEGTTWTVFFTLLSPSAVVRCMFKKQARYIVTDCGGSVVTSVVTCPNPGVIMPGPTGKVWTHTGLEDQGYRWTNRRHCGNVGASVRLTSGHLPQGQPTQKLAGDRPKHRRAPTQELDLVSGTPSSYF